MGEQTDIKASSGDVEIRAVHADNGVRMWQVTHPSGHYSYTTRQGLNDPENISSENFERTDIINISSEGTRYTAEFCWYSADATIFEENGNPSDAFMRSAPDYGNKPASPEFTAGWKKISDIHTETQKQLENNPDYKTAVNDIKRQLDEAGIDTKTFFNKPSNEAIIADSMKGQEREIPSSVYWAKEIKHMQETLMDSEAAPTQTPDAPQPMQSNDIPTPQL